MMYQCAALRAVGGWAGLVLLALVGPAQAQKAKLPELAVPDTLGVNIHFTTPKPGEMEMLAAGGFKWVRMDFTWGGTERKKGEYNFASHDKLIESLKPHGIRALFILDYSNKLYDGGLSPHSEEGRKAMATWAAAAVKHFKGNGILWEMWNEPNIVQFWKPRPNVEDYTKLALEVGKAIRAAAPDELYCGPGTSTIDLPFLEACFKGGCLEYWDAVTVHPYRQKDPETATEEYRKLRQMISQHAPRGKTIPIISGEWGYSAAWNKFEIDRQGRYLAREFLTNLYNEVPLSIWYDWHDDGTDPKEAEHNFGTVKNAYLKDKTPVYEPKPAYLAVQTLSKQLGGFKYNKRLALDDDQNWVLLFSKGADVRVAAWTTSKTPRVAVIPASAGKFTVINHLGDKTTSLTADDKGLKIELTDTVQYLVPEKPNDLLLVAAMWTRSPLEYVVKAPGVVQRNGGVQNPLGRSLKMGPSAGLIRDVIPSKVLEEPGVGASSAWTVPAVVRRCDTVRPITDKLIVEGVGELQQSTMIVVGNSISAALLAPGNGRLPVQIENPSGDAFTGFVELHGVNGIATAENRLPVRIAQGQTLKTIWFNINNAAPVFSAGLKVADDSQRDAQGHLGADAFCTLPPVRFAPFDLPHAGDLAAQLKLHADGDAKVKSEQSMAIDNPPEPPPTGSQRCLKIAYDFDAGWKFIRVAPANETLRTMPLAAKRVGMWVHADGSDNRLRLRYVDSGGQCFQPDGVRLNFKGWKWVTMPLDGEGGHWGGANDGVVHRPIRWDTVVLIDGSKREKVKGEVWVTGVTLME